MYGPHISFSRFGWGWLLLGEVDIWKDRLPELRPAATHDLVLAD